MNDDLGLLKIMMADQKAQPDLLYRPSTYWQGYCERIVKALKTRGLSKFRSDEAISKGYADSAPLDPITLWDGVSWKQDLIKWFSSLPAIRRHVIEPHRALIDYHYSEMSRYREYYFEKEFGPWFDEMRLHHTLPDTMVGDPGEFVHLGGRHVSIAYIRHLLRIHNASKAVDFGKVRIIFEIGGGFGTNAHLLLSMYPNIRKYLYLDIAPILYVATQYLRHFHQDAVVDYLATRNSDLITFKNDDSLEIVCLCPWQIGKTAMRSDLFWNSCSLQEMTPEIIANYAASAGRLAAPGSQACLLMYQPMKPGKVVPVDAILSTFSAFFDFKHLEPAKTDDKPLEYYIGTRKD